MIFKFSIHIKFCDFLLCQIATRVIGDMVCNIIFGLDANGFDDTSDFVEYGKRMFYSTPYDNVRNVIYSIFPFVRHIISQKFVSTEFAQYFVDLFDYAVKLREQNNIERDDYLKFLLELKDRNNTSPELLYIYMYKASMPKLSHFFWKIILPLNALHSHPDFYSNFGNVRPRQIR